MSFQSGMKNWQYLLLICLIVFFVLGFSTAKSKQGDTFRNQRESPDYPPFAWHALPNQGLGEVGCSRMIQFRLWQLSEKTCL